MSDGDWPEAVRRLRHDVQSPLTVISGFASVLADEALPDEQRREYADRIVAAADEVRRLVDALVA